MRGAVSKVKKVNTERSAHDQPPKLQFGRGGTSRSLVVKFSNGEHIFGKVCGKVQDLKLEWRDAPLIDRHST